MIRGVARARGLAVLLAVVLGLLLAACGGATASPSPAASLAGPPPSSPVVGVLVKVDSASLADVKGFTLRLTDGRVVDFRIGTLENAAEFPPGHLSEHLATSDPVRVYFRLEPTGFVAYRIEDASTPAAS